MASFLKKVFITICIYEQFMLKMRGTDLLERGINKIWSLSGFDQLQIVLETVLAFLIKQILLLLWLKAAFMLGP